MAVPKRRTSHSKTRKGRSHKRVNGVAVAYCPQCGTATLPHCVCAKCGFYRGREVVVKEDK